MPEFKLDALLVSSPANVRYLSDYAGSNGLMLITSSECHFFTDPRYEIEAREKVTCKVHVAKGPLTEAAAARIGKSKALKRIGFESAWLHYEEYTKLKRLLIGRTLRPLAGLVESLRMLKSPAEIQRIRASVEANSEAYSQTLKKLRPGLREQEIAAELEYQMRLQGAEKPAFDTIVAAGPHSALPHAHPGGHRLQENELLLIDMGVCLEGYSSDMTRVAYTGTPPKKLRELYSAVLEAQLAAVNAVHEGVPAGSVDRAARAVLQRRHLERQFVHSTGHGLGLEIHEAPRIGGKEKMPLRAGMVITIEPGVYIEGLGGIRIEDTVLVTKHGCEVLTPTPKEFVSL